METVPSKDMPTWQSNRLIIMSDVPLRVSIGGLVDDMAVVFLVHCVCFNNDLSLDPYFGLDDYVVRRSCLILGERIEAHQGVARD